MGVVFGQYNILSHFFGKKRGAFEYKYQKQIFKSLSFNIIRGQIGLIKAIHNNAVLISPAFNEYIGAKITRVKTKGPNKNLRSLV